MNITNLVNELNENCWNKDRNNYVPWVEDDFSYHGNFIGKKGCVKRVYYYGEVEYKICASCENIIQKYKNIEYLKTINLENTIDDILYDIKNIKKDIESIRDDIQELQETLNITKNN